MIYWRKWGEGLRELTILRFGHYRRIPTSLYGPIHIDWSTCYMDWSTDNMELSLSPYRWVYILYIPIGSYITYTMWTSLYNM